MQQQSRRQGKTERGQKATIDENICLCWLNSKKPSSVVYRRFGSLARLNSTQLYEIACGLENSGHPFIWVVGKALEEAGKDKFPDGLEEGMIGNKKGLIIKGFLHQKKKKNQRVGSTVAYLGTRGYRWFPDALWMEFCSGGSVCWGAYDHLAALREAFCQ